MVYIRVCGRSFRCARRRFITHQVPLIASTCLTTFSIGRDIDGRLAGHSVHDDACVMNRELCVVVPLHFGKRFLRRPTAAQAVRLSGFSTHLVQLGVVAILRVVPDYLQRPCLRSGWSFHRHRAAECVKMTAEPLDEKDHRVIS